LVTKRQLNLLRKHNISQSLDLFGCLLLARLKRITVATTMTTATTAREATRTGVDRSVVDAGEGDGI
jgi:hypothetical protein